MTTAESVESSVTVSVENIGGITDTEVILPPGVSVLTGRNATNRTSFLRAIKAVLGSDEVALKGDAKTGSVELEIDGTTYTRTLSRREGSVVFDGDPYLEDSREADLFAFLLESNDARRAVEQGDDLYEVVMRPIDTAEIDAQIETLQEERAAVEAELAELERLNEQLPELEAERREIETAIEEKTAEIDDLEDELEAIEGEREGVEALEERFEELREARNELERVRADIQEEERFVDALREDQDSIEENLDGLAESDAELVRELESDIARLRERSDAIESTLSQLQSAIQFNERMLDGAPRELLGDDGRGEGSVTDRLVGDDEELVCWTCGTEVERDAIEGTVDLLREVHQEKISHRNELKAQIDELQAEKRQVERTEEERRRLRRELETVEADLEERVDRLEALHEEAETLETTVEELEAEVDGLQADDPDERLAVHRKLTEHRVERDGLEADLAAVEDEIAAAESRLEEREDLETQIDEIDAEIADLRSRIERIETDVVEQFNEHMEAILELLEFENLERIWIERVETQGGGGAGQTATFDLHVIRTNASGSVYEDTVDHLSESEREVVGLVFALSGYLVYEVADRVPFMLLDSLEALDADRIGMLVDYLAEQAENLVVALLPEDAQAVDDSYHRLTSI